MSVPILVDETDTDLAMSVVIVVDNTNTDLAMSVLAVVDDTDTDLAMSVLAVVDDTDIALALGFPGAFEEWPLVLSTVLLSNSSPRPSLRAAKPPAVFGLATLPDRPSGDLTQSMNSSKHFVALGLATF